MGGRSGRLQGTAVAVEASQAAGAVPERVPPVEMAADKDTQARTSAAAGLLGDLQRHARGGDDVIAANDALVLEAEDLVEVDAAERHEGGSGVGGRPGELGVESGNEPRPQVAVGGGDGRDARDAQFVDETVLQGAVLTRSLRPRAAGE
jgi:hypothetical protein